MERVSNILNDAHSGIGDSGDDGKSRRKDGEKDEFDAFAQSRTASFDAAKNRYSKTFK